MCVETFTVPYFTLGVCASEPRGALSSVPLAGRVRAARMPSRVGGGDAGRRASVEADHVFMHISQHVHVHVHVVPTSTREEACSAVL